MILIVEIDIFMWVLSIFGHIYLDFIEIFLDWALPNLEYHLFQVIWCVSILIRFILTNDTYSGNRHIYVGIEHI